MGHLSTKNYRFLICIVQRGFEYLTPKCQIHLNTGLVSVIYMNGGRAFGLFHMSFWKFLVWHSKGF